jgi:hypothetical protein
MMTLLGLARGGRPDHAAVFHAFAETLARVMRRRSNVARVRAVRP